MSLEAAITALTEAVKANTAALTGKKASASDTAIEAAAAKKVAGDKAVAPPKKKAVTIETIKSRFGEYLGIEDKAERKLRAGNVKAIVDHFGAAKASELEEENWVEALGYLTQFENDETPDFMGEGGEEDEDDAASMV